MSERGPPIVFDGVWKKFHRGELHDSLRDLIPAMTKRLVGRGTRRSELAEGDFWALRDVCFTVDSGQAIGIIGPNGAGKSTILKLLTRILRPNRGVCRVRGRIGALIEVAGGFHPDLTGRENIFLQGAIMGMRRAETRRKFDEIVEFSGLEEFIDTQVKRYSSGMNARLGFSIAAHFEPDVLIIDEVLSVGDYAFQQKAYARMREIVRSNIPVVLVSHQLDRVASLCDEVILLIQGSVARRGAPAECIGAYLQQQTDAPETTDTTCPIRIHRMKGPEDAAVRSGEYARLRVTGDVTGLLGDIEPLRITVRAAQSGQVVYASGFGGELSARLPRSGGFDVEFELQMNVAPGIYLIETEVSNRRSGLRMLAGPSAYLQVTEGSSFRGTVQLNTRIHRVRARAEEALSRA